MWIIEIYQIVIEVIDSFRLIHSRMLLNLEFLFPPLMETQESNGANQYF